ncbi:hypothetical protein [Hoeflea sp. TYP-13]|uniref:hypothetical protein n=1 Tax=Hoeflea sp. TYP-13 TaxID=3230023 RepID=UPI0034C68F76
MNKFLAEEKVRRIIPSRKAISRARSLLRHHRRSQKEDRSFAGEYAHLKHLVEKLDIHDGFVVDIGASDGVNQSCTLGLFRRPTWSGLAVELRPEQFGQLAFVYTEFSNTQLAMARVTPPSVGPLLASHDVPKVFDVLNIDIDSYDLPVMKSILTAGYRPKIITFEISEEIPPPIYFCADYHEGVDYGHGALFGCSVVAAAESIRPFGYRLESVQYNNAFFVLDAVCDDTIQDQNVEVAYNDGFRNKPDRDELFPWHENLENRLKESPEKIIESVNDRLSRFKGKYTLRISN